MMRAMKPSFSPTVTLRSGVAMPVLGLGVYQSRPGRETRDAVAHALEVGYRHIDTARFYSNEADVGTAIERSGLSREDVFVTTKLANPDHGYDSARRALDRSLLQLGSEYVDLYLVHWPVAGLRKDSWRALVEAKKAGKARAIGVSNYTIRHLEELASTSDVLPDVNQVELSPFLYQRALIEHCQALGIVVEAYSPLTQGRRLGHPAIVETAAKHGKTAAQVMIRWALQHQLVVIPKSVKRARIEENADVFDFELDRDDLALLDGLNEDLHTCWDPTNAP